MTAPRGLSADDVTVAPMRGHHLDAVHSLEQAVYQQGWSRAVFESELGHPTDREYVVALRGGGPQTRPQLVGYAGLMLAGDEAHITTVVVHPAVRRRGIATALVAELLERARERGATAAILEVRASNTTAQSLYRRFGFAPVAVRPDYYDDTGEDAIIMWLQDLQSDATGRRLAACDRLRPAPPLVRRRRPKRL